MPNRYFLMLNLGRRGALLLRSRVQVRARGCTSEIAVCYLLHDPFDGVGTLTALRAAAETVIDLAHPQPFSGLRKRGTNLLITENVARADNHGIVPNPNIGPRSQ